MNRPTVGGVERIDSERFHIEVVECLGLVDAAAEAERISDPASSVDTIHWGRNYLYSVQLRTVDGPVAAVVKQFRNQTWRQRLERRARGSKAERSWRIAVPMWRAGLPTPQPLMLLESRDPAGPSLFVTRQLERLTEVRYLFRAEKAGTVAERFPGLDPAGFAAQLGRLARRLHDAGYWHRDFSIGNVLMTDELTDGVPELIVLDLNRARRRERVSLGERTRDLCRLGFRSPALERRMLDAYWADRSEAPVHAVRLYRLYRRAYLLRVEGKRTVRGALRSVTGTLVGRKPHVHIPDAPPGAGVRDKAVWDQLSDQPHQHASRSERLRVRAVDAGSHARAAVAAAAGLARARARYRRTVRELWSRPVDWPGIGVAVGPGSASPERLVEALEASGAAHVLIRLHPWETRHDDSENLARALAERGVDLTFSLPQVRELVRDPARWRESVAVLAERFRPYGNRFQIGQAINRSKWGVWNYREYRDLALEASEILRGSGPVELLGPAVIDFEPHAMAAAMNYPGAVGFDIAASLLYVDRRGAPENLQLGFDTLGKTALMGAIAATARPPTERLWVTEVNWPLWEGPHSPAGKSVSVDEQRQADYLVRYCLQVLASGLAERVYWWQMVARGYGLIDPRDDGLRRRPSFDALKTLATELTGTRAHGPLPSPTGTVLHRFSHPRRGECLVGWALDGEVRVDLPADPLRCVDRDGTERPPGDPRATLDASPRYFWLPAAG